MKRFVAVVTLVGVLLAMLLPKGSLAASTDNFVVRDFQPVGGFEGDVVGRVGENQVRFLPTHKCLNVRLVGGVAADEAVPADGPDVAALHKRCFL